MNKQELWQQYCDQKLASIDICLHAKMRMRMRAWKELKNLTREELLSLIRAGRLLESKCPISMSTIYVELIFPASKLCVVISADINQLTTVENEHYAFDPDELDKLSVSEKMLLRKKAKEYHLDLEARRARGEFIGRKFRF